MNKELREIFEISSQIEDKLFDIKNLADTLNSDLKEEQDKVDKLEKKNADLREENQNLLDENQKLLDEKNDLEDRVRELADLYLENN